MWNGRARLQSEEGTVTELLQRIGAGEQNAVDQLLPLVYAELQELAGILFKAQCPGHTLQATALVHEAWLKMAGHLDDLSCKRHFLAIAGKAMRQVIVDHARGKQRAKRGQGRDRVDLDLNLLSEHGEGLDVIALDDCLCRLSERNQQHATVAELRLFSGFTIKETAQALGTTTRATSAAWAMAKAWLRKELADVG